MFLSVRPEGNYAVNGFGYAIAVVVLLMDFVEHINLNINDDWNYNSGTNGVYAVAA